MTKGTPCTFCGNAAHDEHHWPILESEGGTRTIPMCRTCHNRLHSALGHRQRWGHIGGKKAQSGPNASYLKNFKQYR